MPKGFGGGGGVGAGMPRPMPNPRFNPAPAPAAGGMGGGLFPNMGAQQRYDMAMGLLKNGMQMGAESGSPLAAFLSPLAGAAIGGSITNKYEKAKAAEVDDITAALMPGGVPPRVAELGSILDNPMAPDYAKAMAKSELDGILKPKAVGGKGGGAAKGGSGRGRGRATSTDVLLSSLLGAALDPNGDGGDTITAAEQTKIDAVNAARGKTPKAAAPAAPTGPVVIDGYTIEQID